MYLHISYGGIEPLLNRLMTGELCIVLCEWCTAGERIASSTNVDALFQNDFFLLVNDKRYLVKVAKEGR